MNVSVIIPTKDRPLLLSRAIDSVLRQDYAVDEIIVVDDGGKFPAVPQSQDRRIVVVRCERSKGGAEARNIGIARSTGSVVMFLDDDDEWSSSKVAAQVRIFRSDPDCVLVYSGRRVRSDSDAGRITRHVCSKVEGSLFPAILFFNAIGITSSVAVRRSIIDAVGGFDSNLPCRQDYDLWIRICGLGKVRWDGEYNVLYTIFDDPGKQVSGQPERHARTAVYLMQKYHHEIAKLPWHARRKVREEKWFSVAKAYRRCSWWKSVIYSCRAWIEVPRIKHLVLLLPSFVLARVGLK